MFKQSLLNIFFLLLSLTSMAKTIDVKTIEELNKANAEAKPDDIIVLKNGEWKNVAIALNCKGTKEQPITFMAETAGKVLITGKSKLSLGGEFIVVDGLNFTNGYAGSDAVISFRIDKTQLANHCRVTNTVINDFNNPKRLDENYWISFYGKNNRLDHCTVLNKKNMGVLLAVILEDDRSRENFHAIDHNHFGYRLPLASNTGEIIRVGVSDHCEFNSNTQITDNFFEHCDGEAEVISIKSCRNVMRNNLFKECQGSVVLRHGHFNTVENNVFLGNNKEGTGGVRVINRGQWVVNNLFYKCRGEGFRSPLSIMNGVPNSPAIRYVSVSNALIANNSFYDCAPFSLCEGSDAERSETPSKVQFINNIFYNTKDSLLYNKFDDISGISFANNLVSTAMKQTLVNGFMKSNLTTQKASVISLPNGQNTEGGIILNDSFQTASRERLSFGLNAKAGYSDANRFLEVEKNAYSACGALWFNAKTRDKIQKTITVNCQSVDEINKQIEKNKDVQLVIYLTGKEYNFNTPINTTTDITLTTAQKTPIKFSSNDLKAPFFIQLKAGKSLSLEYLKIELASVDAKTFISTDTSGSCNHSNLAIHNCTINNSNGNLLYAAKTSILDSIVINNCSFNNGQGVLFNFNEEKDKIGYYNVEKMVIIHNKVTNFKGQILPILRSGKDESTMGPFLRFSNNTLTNCTTANDAALFKINGVQRTVFEKNVFTNCNPNKTLFLYEDIVRASHLFRNNTLEKSGTVVTDKFVRMENNKQ